MPPRVGVVKVPAEVPSAHSSSIDPHTSADGRDNCAAKAARISPESAARLAGPTQAGLTEGATLVAKSLRVLGVTGYVTGRGTTDTAGATRRCVHRVTNRAAASDDSTVLQQPFTALAVGTASRSAAPCGNGEATPRVRIFQIETHRTVWAAISIGVAEVVGTYLLQA